MFNEPSTKIPSPGHWPVDPQTDVEVSKDRIWIDGCFDFSHHGIFIDPFAPEYAAAEMILLRARWCDATGAKTRQAPPSRSSFRCGNHGE